MACVSAGLKLSLASGSAPLSSSSTARVLFLVLTACINALHLDDVRSFPVEERCDGKGITIRVATNTGDLSTITAGFIKLARALGHAARRVRSKPEDTEEAFREVVSLDLDRILSRLWSRHAKRTRKTAGKRPLIEQPHDAIHSRSVRATKTLEESRRRTATIEPSLKAYLPEAIGKLGRYYSAASELVCAARHRDCRLFESIEVEPFQIPMPAFLSMSH
ncbi:hypothetical protein BKA61DRAFT_570770 [Leptodontidium sp. MPI-SDFR-AT-0119]|nr:hypothetical protein BKA61DRAFT_570770 [Leptodontidium sp. MPI-SDFR-AT-0119]